MSEEKKQQDKQEQLDVYEMLIKQQHLILKQSEQLSKERESRKAEDDEIDLRRLIPKFLRKKTNQDDSDDFEARLAKAGQLAGKGFEKSKGVIGMAFRMTQTYLKGLKKFFWIVALGVILGGAYGGYIFTTSEPVYQSTLLIDPGNLEKQFYFSLLEGLDRIAHNKDKTELTRKLGISAEDADKIQAVMFREYRGYEATVKEATDSTEAITEFPFFTVTVDVLDNSVLPSLEEKLFNYLNENVYTKNKRKIKKKILSQDIDQFNVELQLMDSLKQSVINRISKKKDDNSYFVKESSLAPNGIILSQEEKLEVEPLEPFRQSLQMYANKARKEEELLNLDSDFLLIDGFSAVDQPVFPRMRHVVFYVIFAFIASSILTSLLAFFESFKK